MNNKPSCIAIVEDDPDIRRYLERAVALDDGLKLLFSNGDLESGAKLLASRSPDVLLVDLGLPDGSGLELITQARQCEPKVECMVITIHADSHHLMRALECGASGYLLKDALPEDIADSIRELLAGGAPMSPLIARALLKRFDRTDADEADGLLTERETEVLLAMSRGMTRKEISMLLELSIHTINSHVRHIYEKLEVNSNVGALDKARKLHILGGDEL